MNQILTDNCVQTLRDYINSSLNAIYDTNESRLITNRLFKHFNGWGAADLVMNKSHRLSESEILRYHFALKRLLKNEPIQYVLGYEYFHGLKMQVDPSVLIPRPETEELVQWILDDFNEQSVVSVEDICSGSGCIALALKNKRKNWKVTGFDVSEKAVETAKANAIINNLEVTFRIDDVFNLMDLSAEILVSNPPYIPFEDKDKMKANVLEHEPHIALFVDDNDALLFYRTIIRLGMASNNSKYIFFEIHEDYKEQLIQLLKDFTLNNYEFKKDLQGKTRFLKLKLR